MPVLDLSESNCVRAAEGAVEVYNLAHGWMGFIERFQVESLRPILINTR